MDFRVVGFLPAGMITEKPILSPNFVLAFLSSPTKFSLTVGCLWCFLFGFDFLLLFSFKRAIFLEISGGIGIGSGISFQAPEPTSIRGELALCRNEDDIGFIWFPTLVDQCWDNGEEYSAPSLSLCWAWEANLKFWVGPMSLRFLLPYPLGW